MLKARDARGARSVSDLAREAVNAFITHPAPRDEEMQQFLSALQAIVQELKQSVLRLGAMTATCDTTVVNENTDQNRHTAAQGSH